jgi:uncharacterized protein
LILAGLDAPTLGYACVAIFVGGFVRGYTGFGSSMIWVSSLTLVIPPVEIVPILLALEVIASIHLLPQAWSHVAWSSVGWLTISAWVATPLGVALLAKTPTTAMQLAISLIIVASAVVLWRGYHLARTPGKVATVATGAVSGVLNGATSAGGPPVVIFYLSTPEGMSAQRASLIAYFLGSDALGFGVAALSGLVGADSIVRLALFVPAMLIGTALGGRRFLTTTPETFRRATLLLLVMLGIAGVVRAVV